MNFNNNLSDLISEIWNLQIIMIDSNAITIGTLLVGSTFLVIGIFVSRYLSRKTFQVLGTKFKVDRNARHTFESITFYILIFLSLIFSMKMANLPLTIFTVLGGAFAIGFGLGSQNLVNNFMSGLILMIERPIKIGDFVEVDDFYGEVETIGLRSTGIVTAGNRHIIVPNSFFLEKNVRNWTLTNYEVRLNIEVGIAYGSDTELAQKLLIQAANEEQMTLKNRAPEVWFSNFGDSSLNFKLLFWTRLRGINDRSIVESKLRFRIDRLFREGNICIAFPQRDVHLFLKDSIKVADDKRSQTP